MGRTHGNSSTEVYHCGAASPFHPGAVNRSHQRWSQMILRVAPLRRRLGLFVKRGPDMRLLKLIIFIVCVILPFGNSSTATELKERGDVLAATQENFSRGDFNELSQMSWMYQSGKQRTSSGLWRLTLFYVGITAAIDKELKGKPQSQYLPFSDAWLFLSPTVRVLLEE